MKSKTKKKYIYIYTYIYVYIQMKKKSKKTYKFYLNKYEEYKINYCSEFVFFIPVACSRMCVLFYFYFVCLHVCAYVFKSRVNCRSAFEPGASGLPYYCTCICVRSWCNFRASCVNSKPTKKTTDLNLTPKKKTPRGVQDAQWLKNKITPGCNGPGQFLGS